MFETNSKNVRFLPNTRQMVGKSKLKSKVFCVAYTSDGNTILTASQDSLIRMYRVSGHGKTKNYILKKLLQTPYIGWSILDFAISPDGYIVYSTWSKQLYMRKIIDVRDGDITKERQNDSGMPEASMWTPLTVNTQEYRFSLFSLRFNNSGTEIIAGSNDQRLHVFSRELGKTVL